MVQADDAVAFPARELPPTTSFFALNTGYSVLGQRLSTESFARRARYWVLTTKSGFLAPTAVTKPETARCGTCC